MAYQLRMCICYAAVVMVIESSQPPMAPLNVLLQHITHMTTDSLAR